MIFSSYQFIFLFLPVALAGYHLLRRRGKTRPLKLWLIAVSLAFYGIGQPRYLPLFLFFGVSNYLLSIAIARTAQKGKRRALLALTLVWDLGLLVYFKYLSFFVECVDLIVRTGLSVQTLAAPLGISFFTFQTLAYVVDVYRDGKAAGPLDFGVFVSFFPQLIVGPIVKREELMPQLEGERLLTFDTVNIYRGVMLFSIGCAKKILLADPMIAYASAFYAAPAANATLVTAWVGVLAYTLAYYFDFSGYIDMARGIGHLFGVELPINFDSPYRARNFADFWRRWNMTISRFFSESVYARLFRFGDGVVKLILATLATFLVSGLWHGADWHYLVWGLVNGVFVCFANLMTLRRKSLPTPLAVGLTLFFSVLVRVLFDCSSLAQAAVIYQKLFTWQPLRQSYADVMRLLSENWYLVGAMAVGALICLIAKNSNAISRRETFGVKDAAFSAALLTLSVFSMSQVSSFLYFNF